MQKNVDSGLPVMLTHISLIYRTIKNFSRFAYNTRSELIEAHLGTKHYAYSYGNIGNRKTAQELAEESTYEANQLNQYREITQGETAFTPTFDAAGNQTLIKTSTGIWSVSYNVDKRPISFSQAQGDHNTIIECGYDYMGRRYTKKVTINGVPSLHQRYIYRGYLQIASVDLSRSEHPALWYITWDPTEPVATRPLAIQKNATWYTYSHDLTKNVTELYQSDGLIATSYDYSPYGAATSEGLDQPIQYSSEYHDAELALTYYNYRHYNPTDARWITRDPIEEEGENNLYRFVYNNTLNHIDFLGNVTDPTCGSVDSGAGIAIIERQRAAIVDGTYPQQAANEEVGWLRDYIIPGIAHAAKKIGTTLIDIAGSDRVPSLQGISVGIPGVHLQSPTGGPLTAARLKMLGEIVYELIKLKLDTEWNCHNEGFTKESEQKCLDCCSSASSASIFLLTARLIFQGSLLGVVAPSALPKTVAMLIAKHEVELAALAAGSNNCAKNCKKTKCKNDERV